MNASNRISGDQPVRPRVSFHTLGCKLNTAESATIGRSFVRVGYDLVPFGAPADVVVLNTCSVTERADRECRQLVRRIRRETPDAFVAVVGCYAQLRPDDIASIPGVDLVAGTTEKFDLAALVGRGVRNRVPVVARSERPTGSLAHPASSSGFDRTRGFLKVQDGCDYTCAFCTIPLARGVSRSVPRDLILAEAHQMAAAGFRELVLTGVNTGDYGRKEGSNLLSLVRDLVAIPAIERVRISSVEPNLLTDDLLSFWLTEPKLCKHWHIPLQSGSDPVLRLMRRRYGTAWYRDRLEAIMRACPDAGIGADVIVGFPGETDEYFAETYAFIRELPFTYLHVFTYSPRPGTHAPVMDDQVEPRVRFDRSRRLRELGERKRRAFHERLVGRETDVLLEAPDGQDRLTGLTPEYVRVSIPSGSFRPNDHVRVRILSAAQEECFGEALETIPAVAEGATIR